MPRFLTAVFQIEGNVSDVCPGDINRDGRPDFIVLHRGRSSDGDASGRFLSVFIQNENGFSGKPDQTLALDHGEIIFQTADADRDSLPELIFLAKAGVFRKTWSSDSGFTGWTPLIRSRSVFPQPDMEKVIHEPFVRDLDADGVLEILIPQSEWLEVYRPNASGEYALNRKLWVSPDYAFHEKSMFYSIRLPRLVIRDFNADGVPDLLFVQGGRLDVFIQHGSQPFSSAACIPPDFRFRFDVYSSTEKTGRETASVLEVEDVNGDGRADVIEAPNSKTLQIHINRWGRFDPIPDQILQADPISFGHVIKDFNHDGLVDLAFVGLSTGLKSLSQFLFFQKYQRVFKCYFNRADSLFSKIPDFQRAFPQKFQLNDPAGKNSFLSFDGDFNGDGIFDMAVGSAPHAVNIYPGLSKGGFEKKPAVTIHATVSSAFRMADVNGDGVSDVFFWYPGDAGLAGRLVLLISD